MNPILAPSRDASAPTPLMRLSAGPVQVEFEPDRGSLRRIRLGDREVLRGIYGAVRDRNWGTVPAQIQNLTTEEAPDAFLLTFDADCRQEGIHFVWHGSIQGFADGGLRFTFDGEARTDFLRNRIGLCVLHPLRECAGAPARQRRTDGTTVPGRFPDTIEPQIVGQASFRDLRAVAHEVRPGQWAEIEFEGDVFEMEDQRNWTDASFKTYGTPLALPFPVAVRPGTRIHQSVTLRWLDPTGAPTQVTAHNASEDAEVVVIQLPALPCQPMPRLGLGRPAHGRPMDGNELAPLHSLRLAHLRADVRIASPDWPRTLAQSAAEAARLDVGLELALHLPSVDTVPLEPLRPLLQRLSPRPLRVLALRDGEPATSTATLRQVRDELAGLDVPIGVGSDANFCELNREQALGRMPLTDADFIFWAANPQVHASDERSILETIGAHADLVRTARVFAGHRPLIVSPVTLKPRFNAVATDANPHLRPDDTPPPATVDPRQGSWFIATWTLGILTALAESGVASVTFYETTGPRGLMSRTANPTTTPNRLPPVDALFPIYHLFQELAGVDRFAPVPSSRPSRIAALAVAGPHSPERVLLANLTGEMQEVRLLTAAAGLVARIAPPPAQSHHADLATPDLFGTLPRTSLAPHNGACSLPLPRYAIAILETT